MEKRGQYEERIRLVERASFTPLVFRNDRRVRKSDHSVPKASGQNLGGEEGRALQRGDVLAENKTGF